MAKEEAYIKMSPWRSEVEHLEREIMRLEKDRQLKARLIEEENLEKKRHLRQVQEVLKEREMENSLNKVSTQLCDNEDLVTCSRVRPRRPHIAVFWPLSETYTLVSAALRNVMLRHQGRNCEIW